MGKYLDRLKAEYDDIVAGVETITNRAAEANVDLTADELSTIERDQARAAELKKSIDLHAGFEAERAKVADVLSKVPASTGPINRERVGGEQTPPDVEAELKKLFPSAGHYITTVGRSLRGDADAVKIVERAFELVRDTQHQKLADNPGLLPRPILGPVIDLITGNRRFIGSITTRDLPTEKFDRPKITQHVAVGIQANEKDLTASRKLLIENLPVAAKTFAGHLNISRQNIKWSTPSLMQIVAESFGGQYAIETEQYAAEQFYASIEDVTPIEVPAWSGQDIRRQLFAAAAVPLGNNSDLGFPDTLWMSVDVWGELGALTSPLGVPEFPTLVPAAPSSGSIGGFNGIVVPSLPAGTAVIGRGALLEWYEDLDGLIQVAEPDVQGQLVGYAGYGAFLNTAPELFSVLSFPEVTGAGAAATAEAKAAPKK